MRLLQDDIAQGRRRFRWIDRDDPPARRIVRGAEVEKATSFFDEVVRCIEAGENRTDRRGSATIHQVDLAIVAGTAVCCDYCVAIVCRDVDRWDDFFRFRLSKIRASDACGSSRR